MKKTEKNWSENGKYEIKVKLICIITELVSFNDFVVYCTDGTAAIGADRLTHF